MWCQFREDVSGLPNTEIASTSTKNSCFTVLVVNADRYLRLLVYGVLEQAGYAVLATSNSDDALLICRKSVLPIHLLVTDVEGLQLSGWELSALATRLQPKMRSLLLSSSRPGEAEWKITRQHGWELLQKPFSSQRLLRTVRELFCRTPDASCFTPPWVRYNEREQES